MTSIDVVVRCKNEMPYAEATFRALDREGLRVVVFDSGSTDGSRELAVSRGFDIVDIAPEAYVPGRVLNQAMEATRGDIVAFVNADAIPLADDAVEKLVEVCKAGASASYGRQVARASARPVTRADYERVFPEHSRGPGFRHFFSMAASAIRRDVWQALPFDPRLRYSEDIDWTWRVRALGGRVVYVPDARFEHSHDYDARGMWKRMTGEGRAEVPIFRKRPAGVVRGGILPLAAQAMRDLRAGILNVNTLGIRAVAQAGRLQGMREAVRASGEPGAPNPSIPLEAPCTIGRTPEAERMVRSALEAVRDEARLGLSGRYRALLLLGGFASGEGAIDGKGDQIAIHNDLDLVAVVDGRLRAARLRKRCEHVAERASKRAHAPVDLYPIAWQDLQRPQGRLLWVDAVLRGVRVIDGDPSVLDGLKGLSGRSVVPAELGRLLANRATGLALSRLAFAAGRDEASRAARHVAKAWQALGDAVLYNTDHFRRGMQERSEELARLAGVGAPWLRAIAEGYAQSVRYRRDPAGFSADKEELEAACARLGPCVAALEAYRLGLPDLGNADELERVDGPLFPELGEVPATARLIAGPRAAAQGKIAWSHALEHPREVLARVSHLLAFGTDLDAARARATSWLGTQDASASGQIRALERLREVAA